MDLEEAERVLPLFATYNPKDTRPEAEQVQEVLAEQLDEAIAYKMIGTPSGPPAHLLEEWMRLTLAWEIAHPEYRKGSQFAPTAALN